MSRPPRARESVLDAFEAILIEEGERAATLEATARTAGVSKGGLLYHFESKDALEVGLLDRLTQLVDEDVDAITQDARGAVDYFLRSSVMTDSPLDRAIIAVSRLAQGGSAAAGDAIRDMRERWTAALRPHTRDQASLDLILLVSEGLYYTNALQAGALVGRTVQGSELDALITLVQRAVQPA